MCFRTQKSNNRCVNYKTIISRGHLSAADGCAGPHGEDREDPHEEGQDGGQQEAPPLPLPATYNIEYNIGNGQLSDVTVSAHVMGRYLARVAQIKKVVVLMAYFLLSDH